MWANLEIHFIARCCSDEVNISKCIKQGELYSLQWNLYCFAIISVVYHIQHFHTFHTANRRHMNRNKGKTWGNIYTFPAIHPVIGQGRQAFYSQCGKLWVHLVLLLMCLCTLAAACTLYMLRTRWTNRSTHNKELKANTVALCDWK